MSAIRPILALVCVLLTFSPPAAADPPSTATLEKRIASLEQTIAQSEAQYEKTVSSLLQRTAELEAELRAAENLDRVQAEFAATDKKISAALSELVRRVQGLEKQSALAMRAAQLPGRVKGTGRGIEAVINSLDQKLLRIERQEPPPPPSLNTPKPRIFMRGLFYAWMVGIAAGLLTGLLALVDFIETMRTKRSAPTSIPAHALRALLYMRLKNYIEARTAATAMTIGFVLATGGLLWALRPSTELTLLAATITALSATAFIVLADYAFSLLFALRCTNCGKNLVYTRRVHAGPSSANGVLARMMSVVLQRNRSAHPGIANCPFCKQRVGGEEPVLTPVSRPAPEPKIAAAGNA
jgi:uncharacterized protein with PQ loop repeat